MSIRQYLNVIIELKIAEKVRSFSEIKKPKVPTLADKPIMGLKSDKNYIISNAVDVILSGKDNVYLISS